MESNQAISAIAIFGFMFAINADAATGATFGSAFFILSATHYVIAIRAAYAAISTVFGYSVGVGVGGDWAMLSAIFGSVGAIVVLETILHGGEPTPLMKWLLELIRGRK